MPWILRKARTRDEDVGPALARMHHHMALMARGDNKARWAAWHFRKAAVLDPAWDRPLLDLAVALCGMERFDEALRTLDKRLERAAPPGLRARYLNQKALVHLWAARDSQKKKDAPGRLNSLEQSMAVLVANPLPDPALRWRVGLELAQALAAGKNHAWAAVLLEGGAAPGEPERLEGRALLALCRARLGQAEAAGALARELLSATAERERGREPVTPETFETLGKVFEELDRQDLARIMERKATPDTPGGKG